MNIYLIWGSHTPDGDPTVNTDIGLWSNIDFIFRLFFFVFLIIIGTASCIQILKAYKINYIYIFEIEPRFQVTYWQLYGFSLLMLSVLNFCLLIQVIVFKFNWDFPNDSKIPTILLTVLFLLGIMFNPLRVLYGV